MVNTLLFRVFYIQMDLCRHRLFLNRVVSATDISNWGISNNVLAVLDRVGNFYYYTPVFSGNDIVVMTFSGSTGISGIAVGTQLYYTRVR
ncbi:MAG: hypothetical protein ACI8YQ_000723 [Polaribacter sp.]|jgi:hypothetical protein